MTCWENLRKQSQTKFYPRLETYFNALENNQLEQYRKKHGREGVKK